MKQISFIRKAATKIKNDDIFYTSLLTFISCDKIVRRHSLALDISCTRTLRLMTEVRILARVDEFMAIPLVGLSKSDRVSLWCKRVLIFVLTSLIGG
jgi:hypothetical protein